MSVEKAIVCDGCSQVMGAARTAAEARRAIARDVAGARVGLVGGRDLCDECAIKGS